MIQEKDNQEQRLEPETDGNVLSDAERREALKKIGHYAAYAAPLMVGLLTAEKALANPSV